MIEKAVADWHTFTKGEGDVGIHDLLADECVFYSPVVFTPQAGRGMTAAYLLAACEAFGGEVIDFDAGRGRLGPTFKYVKEVMSGHTAVLEFECEVDGKYVNGVDIITCDNRGKIVEFKVMVRPLQAMQVLHAKMAEMLEKMRG